MSPEEFLYNISPTSIGWSLSYIVILAAVSSQKHDPYGVNDKQYISGSKGLDDVGVIVGVNVGVGVNVDVSVGVTVGVTVSVTVGVTVDVSVGVIVGV